MKIEILKGRILRLDDICLCNIYNYILYLSISIIDLFANENFQHKT